MSRYGEHFYFYIIKLSRVHCEYTHTDTHTRIACIRDTVSSRSLALPPPRLSAATDSIADWLLKRVLSFVPRLHYLYIQSLPPLLSITAGKWYCDVSWIRGEAESDPVRKVVNLNPKRRTFPGLVGLLYRLKEKKNSIYITVLRLLFHMLSEDPPSIILFCFLSIFVLLHGTEGNREKKFGRIVARSAVAAVIQGIIYVLYLYTNESIILK